MDGRLRLTLMNRIVRQQKNMKITGTNVSGTMKKQLKMTKRIVAKATKTNKNNKTNRSQKSVADKKSASKGANKKIPYFRNE